MTTKMTTKMTMFLISIILIFFGFSLYSDAPFTSTPLGHERMFVAYSDGTVSLINDTDTQDVLWSVKTGRPICESYQASSDLDTYIDCQHDWNMYKHDSRKCTVKKIKTSDLMDETSVFAGLGFVASNKIRIGFTLVEAHTGHVLFRRIGTGIPEYEENPKVERENMRDKFAIIRKDYEIGVKAIIQRNTIRNARVIWNVRVAEFMVQSHTSPGLTPSSQRHNIPVHRVHIADSDV